MYRTIAIAVFCALVIPAFAFAADGHSADISISVTMDMAMLGDMGENQPEDMPEMEPMEFPGVMYWTADAMRIEINMGMMGGDTISLIDHKSRLAYQLDPESKTAIKISLDEQMAEMEELGMPMLQPDQMLTNWDQALDVMKAMPSVKVNEIGTTELNGRSVEEIDISMDMAAMAEDSGMTVEELEEMGMSGSFIGKYWVDPELNMPVRMDMTFMGTTMVWLLTNIADWQSDDALMAVPEDYTVTTYEEMMTEMMSEMSVPEEATAE